MKPPDSLLSFENPRLLTSNDGSACSSKQKSRTDTSRELLNQMFPPRNLTDDKMRTYLQQVSSKPCTVPQVVRLRNELDQKLRQNKAIDVGLCPIRRRLHGELFDEVIRQTTLGCAERGQLMIRIRDEIRETMTAFQQGYESSQAYLSTKSKEVEAIKNMDTKIAMLEKEKVELLRKREVLEEKNRSIKKNNAEQEKQQEDENIKSREERKQSYAELKAKMITVARPKTPPKTVPKKRK